MDILINFEEMGCGNVPSITQRGRTTQYTGVMTPRSAWVDTEIMRDFVPRGKCQFNQPSCNSYTTGKGQQTKYAMQIGRPGFVQPVSYSALHMEITGGRMNQGSIPLDAIKFNVQRGLVPATTNVPEWFANPRSIPSTEQANRMLVRADEWDECVDGEQVASAIIALQPCNIGIWWYDTDVNPGPTGELREYGNRQLGGHSVLAIGLRMNYKYSRSGVGIVFNNHHGDSKTPATTDERGNRLTSGVWGDDGFGIVPIERLNSDLSSFTSYALRSVRVNNEDIP